jgi:hypothetical protein
MKSLSTTSTVADVVLGLERDGAEVGVAALG